MDEAVQVVVERALSRAADLLDKLRPEVLDGAEGSLVVAGVRYHIRARVVRTEGGREQAVPDELPPRTRRSVVQVYETCWRMLMLRGPDAAVGARDVANDRKQRGQEELSPRAVYSALSTLANIGLLHHNPRKGYSLPTPALFG